MVVSKAWLVFLHISDLTSFAAYLAQVIKALWDFNDYCLLIATMCLHVLHFFFSNTD